MGKGTVMKIVMIEDDRLEVQRFAEYFEGVEDMELVAAVDGAAAGLAAVEVNAPDAVILDLELSEGNGVQLLPQLKALPRAPFVLVTTWTTDAAVIKAVRANGSGHVQSKAMPGYGEKGPEMVASFLREVAPFFRREPAEQQAAAAAILDPEERRRRRVVDAMGRIGITPGTFSHNYLVDSILLAAKAEGCIVDLDNVIYPALMKKYHVTRVSLEKAMRTRIEAAWRRTDVETLQREFTQYVNPEKGKPELKEFIGYYATKFSDPNGDF